MAVGPVLSTRSSVIGSNRRCQVHYVNSGAADQGVSDVVGLGSLKRAGGLSPNNRFVCSGVKGLRSKTSSSIMLCRFAC